MVNKMASLEIKPTLLYGDRRYAVGDTVPQIRYRDKDGEHKIYDMALVGISADTEHPGKGNVILESTYAMTESIMLLDMEQIIEMKGENT